MQDVQPKVAILYRGDLASRSAATSVDSRFAPICQALEERGAHAQAAAFHEDALTDVRSQLLAVDAVLVWVNPIDAGRDRSVLDPLLREVAGRGVYVSAHPEVILALGTKEILYQTRHMSWAARDTRLHRDFAALEDELPKQIAQGQARVLKQYRGNGGDGVWKVEPSDRAGRSDAGVARVRVRHAKRGSVDETLPLAEFIARCAPYFAGDGRIINQPYQARLPEGMIRCYLVHDKVQGFGHQAVNALCPVPADDPSGDVPKTTPRLYYPPTRPEFQHLKDRLEQHWVAELQQLLGLRTDSLPVLWDCDFLLGERDASGADTYVLCEINVSSVSPFPVSAVDAIAEATLARIVETRARRATG